MIFYAMRRLSKEILFFMNEMAYFYYNKPFRSFDFYLKRLYLLKNPYKVAKHFNQSIQAKEIYTYGETPLHIGFQLIKLLNISPKEHIIDLGCGRGRLLGFMHFFTGAQTSGYDINPTFCHRIQKVITKQSLKKISIYNKDYISHLPLDGTIYYLCDLFLLEKQLDQLIWQLKKLRSRVKIISVGYPLKASFIDELYSFNANFLWGNTLIYIQEINHE